MSSNITIAVSKGRIFKDAMPLLAALDIYPVEAPETTRKLILETNRPDVKIIIVRTTDVPTYVEYGAADIGIAGKDVLLEYGSNGLYEPLDLKIAQCKMVVAEHKQSASEKTDVKEISGRKRVATKYVNIARNYFASQGKQVEIIKLYGSMELAPVLGLADQIVDLVDTGNTLKANGLVEVETITDISSRLIVNKGAMKMKNDLIKPMIEKLTEVVEAK
ncbi:MAG: ATP phosphoribosyltransferase [Gammaproteobacteria bacterium]|jgi:ATP phosphoribosyltransferase|nr:ATP phosphoribosyltransferase [Gammaproteobacteria bacterium]